ncbi:MAG: rod-binding protein [Gemmatimonadetes bacterium]|nr:rod-binding protein [Gemmatimonadota bacterium]
MNEIGRATAGGAPGAGEMTRLRAVSRQMEGVFVQQLYKAMRDTVPEGGFASGGQGEEMFTGLLDQHLSDATAASSSRGPGEALFRQMSAALRAKEAR